MELVHPESTLRTQRLILQPILPAHATALFTDLQDPNLYTFIPQNPPKSEEALKGKYTLWSQRQSADGSEIWLNYALYRLSHLDYVGTVQATLQKSGKNYIAYEIFSRCWRCGFAREACVALITHLFNNYKVSTISAHVDTRNKASWKLLESLDFKRVETIENADEFKGSTSDEYVYELHPVEQSLPQSLQF